MALSIPPLDVDTTTAGRNCAAARDSVKHTNHFNSTGHHDATTTYISGAKEVSCGKGLVPANENYNIAVAEAKKIEEQPHELYRTAPSSSSSSSLEEEEHFFNITHFHYKCLQPVRQGFLTFWQFRCWWDFDVAVRTSNSSADINKVHCTNHGYDISNKHRHSSYIGRREEYFQPVRYYPCQEVAADGAKAVAIHTAFRMSAYITDPETNHAALIKRDELRLQYEVFPYPGQVGKEQEVFPEAFQGAVKVKSFTLKPHREFRVALKRVGVTDARAVAPPSDQKS